MKTKKVKLLSVILAFLMIIPFFASCKNNTADPQINNGQNSSSTEYAETDSTEGKNTEESTELRSEASDTQITENNTEYESETEEETYPLPTGENAELIQNANNSINKVNAYFSDHKHTEFVLENTNMSFAYNIADKGNMCVARLVNSSGNKYFENTMDVFVKMKNGNVFYTSNSAYPANANLYRFGYYYYEARFEEQIFSGEGTVTAYLQFQPRVSKVNHLTHPKYSSEDKSLNVSITNSTDPYIVFDKISFSADEYKYIQFTAKVENPSAYVYIISGDSDNFNDSQCKPISLLADGEYHTYLIPLSSLPNYYGEVSGLRLDFSGEVGDSISVKDIKAIALDNNSSPDSLSISRSFLVYTDKMHHYVQVASTKETKDIEHFGLLTNIPAETVDKIIVKDKNGLHNTLDSVDWSSAEYVGFDIKNAGIFGYILPYDNLSGKLTVTLEDGAYMIEQICAPENGTVIPSEIGSENANDFYFGQRIYTDESHSFDKFIIEAECERHPLTENNIIINVENSDKGSFDGYNALRGYYSIYVEGGGNFNTYYYSYPQKKFNLKFSVIGDDYDRKIYISTYNGSGCLECAVILDKNDMLLPVPIEVGKNFSEASGDRNLYNLDDKPYSEALFPMVIKSKMTEELRIVHLYQMWGRFPLKQLSWIQYSSPYYHMSTGVTETNCIIPFGYIKNYRSFTYLPDFRAMSAPFWSDQPQHNRGGDHAFMLYTDSNGAFSGIENVKNIINSYGPTYSEVKMEFISDDGNIKLTLIHLEMPQTDENRAYYQMKYEILGDLSFNNFGEDFSFYSVDSGDPTGLYNKVGYLDQDNNCTVVEAIKDESIKKYVLGDNCPYFDFFDMTDYTSTAMQGYTNLSMLVKNASFVIGGENVDPSFLLINTNNTLRLSLDLERVDLKKGDNFTINAILMPWGSQETDYSGDAPDKNVRDVRENSLLDPVTVEAGKNTEIIDTVFLPSVRSINGSFAEFTLSGGTNNIAIRAYGFNMLTVPVVEELTDLGWVEYQLNSVNCPDDFGNRHQFDGYAVHYDKDGTYSYSFVVDMTDFDSRTFRIKTIKKFDGWGEMPELESFGSYKNYSNAEKLFEAANSHRLISKEVMDDGAYIRYKTEGPDFWILVPAGPGITGQYAVMKYRIIQPVTDQNKLTSFEIFTSTENSTPAGGDNINLYGSISNDGQWHLLIIDLAALDIPTFKADDFGNYCAKYLRLDIINYAISKETSFDIAFIGITENMSAILEENKEEFPAVDLCIGSSSTKKIDSSTGEDYIPKKDGPEHYNAYISAEKLYGSSSIRYDSVTLSNEKDYVSYKTSQNDAGFTVNFSGETGKYLIMKYRVINDPDETFDFHIIELFASTKNAVPTAGDNIEAYHWIIPDENWQLMIIDLEALEIPTYVSENGSFSTKYVRIDTTNSRLTHANTSFDIAYIATGDDLAKILEGNSEEFDTAMLCTGGRISEKISTK